MVLSAWSIFQSWVTLHWFLDWSNNCKASTTLLIIDNVTVKIMATNSFMKNSFTNNRSTMLQSGWNIVEWLVHVAISSLNMDTPNHRRKWSHCICYILEITVNMNNFRPFSSGFSWQLSPIHISSNIRERKSSECAHTLSTRLCLVLNRKKP